MMRLISVGILVLLFHPFLFAQDKEVTLEDIFDLVSEGKVVTATKTERLLKTAPEAVTVITKKQIEESGASSIAEALRFVPGVNVRLTPMGSVIGIRSFGPSPFTERVLLLIDGTPYNSPDKGGYPGHPAYEDFFPIEHVKRIEVIKGPGSALYGQNAYFGIVNIISDDFKEEGSRQAIVQAGSRDVGRAAISHGGQSGDWNYSFTGKYKNQDGPMQFDRDTNIKSGDLFAKLKGKGLSLSYLFHKDEAGPFLIDANNHINTQPTDQSLNFIDAGYNKKLSDNWNWSVKGFFNRRNGNTCESCHNALSAGHPSQLVQNQDEVNQRLFFNTQFDWIVASHKIIFGADFQSDKTEKDIAKLPLSDPIVNTAAGFVQDEISLADGRAIITGGVRLDNNEITGNSVSPSLSGVFLPTAKVVLRTSYGRAFRQPTWNDLFIDMKFNPAPVPNIVMNGNPQLDTEKIDTFEAGAEFLIDPRFSVKADYFHSRVQDFVQPLEFRPTGATILAVAQNRVGDIDSDGVEIEARFKPDPRFSAIIGYAYQTNKLHSVGSGFDDASAYSPQNKFTGIITFAPVEPLNFDFSFNYWSEFNARAFPSGTVRFGEEIGQPYTYANFQTSYSIPVSGQHIKLGFLVKNVFDETEQLTPVFGVDTSLYGREYYGSVAFSY